MNRVGFQIQRVAKAGEAEFLATLGTGPLRDNPYASPA